MIIRVDDELRKAVLRPAGTPPSNKREADAEMVISLLPQWLKDAMTESSIVIIENDEWLEIPFEAKNYLWEMKKPRP